ncbi:MAG: hypothetical protein H6625_07140 [Bdellovibrionaceae bacterium]|nr:hypothetical protein [Pseudobdellovibrionaceae bacterium]
MTALILLLVFFSGFTGLIYQVIWQKYLSAYLGSHALATSQVLACFFLFLAIGYFVIGKYQHRLVKNKVFLYGIIEGLIGGYALISPDFFFWLTNTFSFYGESLFTDLLYSLLLTGVFIGFPTFLMGGTIPVLTQGLVKVFQKSHKMHSWIYSINTIGAFLGTLMGGFYFIENHGLPFSLLIVGLINLAIFVVCYVLWKIYPLEFLGLEEQVKANEDSQIFETDWLKNKMFLYVLSFLSGFYVFSLENIVIKIAGLSIGSSTYTYTIIVSAFIFSIAIGSSLVSFVKKIESVNLLYGIQLLLLISLVALYFLIPEWPMILGRVNMLISKNMFNFPLKWVFVLIIFIFMLTIPVGLMGTNLPLLFSYLKQRHQYLSKTVGRLYGINSIGGFLGALFGGYYILMWVPLDVAMKMYIVLVSSTVVVVSFLFYKKTQSKRLKISISIFVVTTILVSILPKWQPLAFTPGPYLNLPNFLPDTSYSDWYKESRLKVKNSLDLLFSKSGPNTWAIVSEDKKTKERTLHVNGKADAATLSDASVRALNMLIPLSIKPLVEDVFIVGLGASLSTGIATSFKEVKNVEVAEISQGVIDSMSFFNEHAFEVMDRADKFKVYHVDALRKLKSSKLKYDLIVSEPSNLWVTGVELLFSLEFLNEAKNHLKPGGVYSQWFPLFEANEDMLRMVLANFNSVFPWVTLWMTGPYTINIIASDKRINVSSIDLKRKFDEQKSIYEKFGLSNYQSILGMQALPEGTTRGLVVDVNSFHSIEWPRLEIMANRNGFLGKRLNLNSFLLAKMIKPLPVNEPEFQFIYQDLKEPLNEDFYIENIKKLEIYGAEITGFIRRRLMYEYGKNFKKAKLKLVNKVQKSIEYFISGTSKIDLKLEEDLKTFFSQVEIFKVAITMHLPVNSVNLLSLVPDNCLNLENCYKAKKYLSNVFKGKQSVADLEIKKSEWKDIEIEFKKINY